MIVSFGVVLAEIREVVSGSWVFILVWIILIPPPPGLEAEEGGYWYNLQKNCKNSMRGSLYYILSCVFVCIISCIYVLYNFKFP